MCRLGKAKVLSIFLCPALPNRPHQTVVVMSSGQDGLSQTLYLQKWPKSAFEIVVRVGRKKISAVNDSMVLAMFPLVRRNSVAAAIPYADFAARLAPYGISQSEFIRRAIQGASIRPVVTVSPINDELLAALGKLTAEYGRIGSNLNQIARAINDWHNPYPQLAAEVRAAASDLAALKFEILEKVGEAVGNVQTYQL